MLFLNVGILALLCIKDFQDKPLDRIDIIRWHS